MIEDIAKGLIDFIVEFFGKDIAYFIFKESNWWYVIAAIIIFALMLWFRHKDD